MMQEEDISNESAFPTSAMDAVDGIIYQEGLTKREYFAGLAMQGLLSRGNLSMTMSEKVVEAVYYADALLRELSDDEG